MGENVVEVHLFLTVVLGGNGGKLHVPAARTPGPSASHLRTEPLHPLNRRLGGPQSLFWRRECLAIT